MMNNLSEVAWQNAAFSLVRALLGEITGNMRAISIENTSNLLKVWVYTYAEATSEEKEEFDASVMTQIVSDYPDHCIAKELSVEFEFLSPIQGERIEPNGRYLFLRNEDKI